MEACTMRAEQTMKTCYNCRRFRRTCDRSIPSCIKCISTGQVCQGYGKLLKWTNSVASRGKLMGKTHPSLENPQKRWISRVAHNTDFAACHEARAISDPDAEDKLLCSLKLTWQLGDPTFHDLSNDREVCKDFVLVDMPSQNPFRDLLLLSADHPVLQHIIVANSALHLANATGKLLEVYRDALVAKQRALRLLSEALSNRESIVSDAVLASMMLFVWFELLDSGRNGWKFHIEGARQLMIYLSDNAGPALSSLDSLRDCLIANCAIYDILGTTLTAPSKGMKLPNLASIISKSQANNCLSCPPLLLQIIRDIALGTNSTELPEFDTNHFLSLADAFDPCLWAKSLQQVSSCFDLDMRTHIGCAYKAAVKIYIVRSSRSINSDWLEDLVSEVIQHLEHIPIDDPFFKTTCWPSFMAGAETNNLDSRAWVSSRFKRGLQNLPWGYLSSAIDLLGQIWSKRGDPEAQTEWLINLKLSENDWLIA